MSKSQNPLKIADRYLLSPHGLGEAELEKTFRKLMRHDIDFADLYFQYQRSEAWSLEEGIVKAGSFSIDADLPSQSQCLGLKNVLDAIAVNLVGRPERSQKGESN